MQESTRYLSEQDNHTMLTHREDKGMFKNTFKFRYYLSYKDLKQRDSH